MQFDVAKLNWILSLISQNTQYAQYGIIGHRFDGMLLPLDRREAGIRTVRSALAESRESADTGLQRLSDGLEEVRSVLKADPEPRRRQTR